MTSNTRCEIIVWIDGVSYMVDTFDVVPVPLTYEISDIRDIDKRKSSSSLTIKIPETSNNRSVFNNISDLSTDLTYFNPNKKSPVNILVDSIVVFRGNLQLTDLDVDIFGNVTSYNCTLFSESEGLFSLMGESLLSDLDVSELGHTYSKQNVMYSWTQSVALGYVYPMIDSLNRSVNQLNGSGGQLARNWMRVDDFKPATYIKYIWDKIFTTNGYTYTSEFLNGSLFKSLIMPFASSNIQVTSDYKESLSYNIVSTSYSIVNAPGPSTSNPSSLYLYSTIHYDTAIANPNNIWDTSIYRSNQGPETRVEKISGGISVIIPNGELESQFSNDDLFSIYLLRSKYPGNYYAANFIAPNGAWVTFSVASGANATDFNNINTNTFGPGFGDYNLERRDFTASGNPWPLLAGGVVPLVPFAGGLARKTIYRPILYSPSFGAYFPYTQASLRNFPDSIIAPINTQQEGVYFSIVGSGNARSLKVDVLYETDLLNNQSATPININDYYKDTDNLGPALFYTPFYNGEHMKALISFKTKPTYSPANVSLMSVVGTQSTFIKNLITGDLAEGGFIDYNTVLPSNLKQKDFITSIIKMFNLYIDIDRNNPTNLIIEPRDDYYNNGVALDWSDKFDSSKPVNEVILSEIQPKSTLFTYKSDSDYYNTDYTSKLKRNYGDLRYVIDNDFIKSEKKIEPVFSPTPLSLVLGSNGIVIPSIYKQNNGQVQSGQSFNYRILIYGGLITLQNQVDSWNFGSSFNYDKLSYYPYAGHFDNPYAPTVDINFGQSYLYYSNIPTLNNLFTTYWQKTMDELSNINSRLISLHLKLTPLDINSLRFNNLIYLVINGVAGYYRLNKIKYDASDYSSSEVELIKAIDVTINEFISTNQPISVGLAAPGNNQYNQSLGSFLVSSDNTSGNTSVVNGSGNNAGGNNVDIIGHSNSANSDVARILGNFNTTTFGEIKDISGTGNIDYSNSSAFINGNNNNIYEGVNSNSITGNYNVVTASNTITIGNSNIIRADDVIVIGNNTKAITSGVIYINGPQVASGNYINASENEVLNPFSDTKFNYVNASRNAIRNLGSETTIMLFMAGRDEV